MKKLKLFVYAIVTLVSFNLTAAYKDVSIELLRANTEDYSNKKITIETKYIKLIPIFPNYFEYSGLKSKKYYYLKAAPVSVPALTKKTSGAGKVVIDLKKNSKIKLYGKIRKFKKITFKRKHHLRRRLPRFYLEVEKLEIIK